MRYDDILDAIGHTPLLRLDVPAPSGVEVYAKLELQNLFAMKDRVAKRLLLDARQTGELVEGAPIIESSSGTMALGLALVGSRLGHPVHIVTDPRIDPITLAKLRALGCAVHIVEQMTGGGWQSARLELLARLRSRLDGAFWPRQYGNPQNPAAYAALADELKADLGDFDVLVGAVGSGGSLCGTARALLPSLPRLTTVAVDTVGSVLFGQPDRPERLQSGLGNSIFPENLDYAMIDEVHWLSDAEAFGATRSLAREQKIFAGNTSGSVYRVLRHLAEQAAPGTRLVGIFPDRGDRYINSVYGESSSEDVGRPVQVRYGTQVSRWSYAVLGRTNRPRFVFVESNTTGSGMEALRTTQRLGMDPVLVTGNPERYPGLADAPARVVVCDTNDPAELRRVLDHESADGRLVGVGTTSEFYLIPVAELSTALGLAGNPPAAMSTCRNKALTRDALKAAGVRQPRYEAVREAHEVAAAAARIGLPCVIKPADDSGSNNVLLCTDIEQAVAHAASVLAVRTNVRGQQTAGTVLVESYLAAPEYSVELLVGDARIECLGITAKYLADLPFFVEHMHVFPADLPKDDAEELEKAARAAVTACGMRQGVAHVELKLTTEGPAVVEVNGRPAGGMIPELIRLSCGVDLLEQHLRTTAGIPLPTPDAPRRYAGIRFLLADNAGILERVDGVPEAQQVTGIARVTVSAAPGTRVRPPRNAYDRLGHLIAVGPSAAEVQAALAKAVDQISLVVSEGGPTHEEGQK
ncbi:pyridoxal-phosphate dependent enzyme [Catellatospora chokoriensis]|uniref:ATP-grasp domain-containing protein n=1 Tax=Catellatospora chokoriensis TaxID=310353 RepID=A0A8J3NNY4_9ACTN|nr:pyridoxal-phosphate dependent enzyme [Catellatospora chokoriensis]GIF87657.1 hypothetical protein Cch02nite_11010 [Catellatospora chokoriensis]